MLSLKRDFKWLRLKNKMFTYAKFINCLDLLKETFLDNIAYWPYSDNKIIQRGLKVTVYDRMKSDNDTLRLPWYWSQNDHNLFCSVVRMLVFGLEGILFVWSHWGYLNRWQMMHTCMHMYLSQWMLPRLR